jgi:glycosyltransferase involved in cell wall biosynthesis
MENTKITVITITYNIIKADREKYFRQCIESVHNQTYKNIEHIIIDGASDDGTIDIIKEYEQKGWISYFSEKDTGIYNAMNKGLKHATGEYITYLNSDDYYCKNDGIEEVVKALNKNKEKHFAYSSNMRISRDGRIKRIQVPNTEIFFVRMPFCHQTLFVKTEVMKDLGGFNEKYKSAGDYEFVLRLYLNKYCGFDYNYIFVTFRDGGFSFTDYKKSQYEFILAYKELYGKLIDKNIDYRKMFYDMKCPVILFNKIMENIDENISIKIKKYIKKKKIINKSFYYGDIIWAYRYINRFNIIKHHIGFTKRYIFGIPYSSYQEIEGCKITRTFFQMLKKKKSYMYSKYYFLGIQFWCKKRSKIKLLRK